jgi:5'-3' exonuclease
MDIDTFMIDLNGIFHNSAAKVYQYGAHERKSLLRQGPTVNQNTDQALKTRCFEDICATIDELVSVVRPRKSLVMCIDGVAPLSKQNQQRQRRYRSLVEDDGHRNSNVFDSRCITPGTKFMDHLSKYIDWYIKKQISENDKWKNLEVVFSNEKVPGEGEHKLIDYIRKFGKDEEVYCINALDADLVMLSLGTHKKNFYLLREDLYNPAFDYAYFNVGSGFSQDLVKNVLSWEGADEKRLINDFILFCCLCGNDFLPNIPSISLLEKGMSTIIDLYKSCGNHLTDENGSIIKSNFQIFLAKIGQSEKPLLEEKFQNRGEYIQDITLESHVNSGVLDFDAYRDEFYKKHDMHSDLEETCHSYFEGCEWVLTYYIKGIDDWSYLYKKNYAPLAYDLSLNLTTYHSNKRATSGPIPPFLQLLCVIPPTSAYLLPKPLDSILTRKSPLSKYFPTSFTINYEGKKKKWEGVVELPSVDLTEIRKEYLRVLSRVEEADSKINLSGRSFSYKRNDEFSLFFKSYYGSFTCFCATTVIDF